MDVELVYRIEQEICLISFEAEMLGGKVRGLSSQIAKSVEEKQARAVALNLQNVRHIDSIGVGVVITLFKILQKKKIEFALCHVNSTIVRILELVGLEGKIQIFETESEAIKAFQQ